MKKLRIAACAVAVVLIPVIGYVFARIATETAKRGPSDTPNSAFVPAGYPETKVPYFISVEDKRDWEDRGTVMYIKMPATDDHELRIYPSEIDDETAKQLKVGEALLGIKSYVEEYDGPNRKVSVQ